MKKLNKLEDEELIFFLRLQNEEAFTILLRRYEVKARILVYGIMNEFTGTGLSVDELVNVALNTLRTAVKGYKPSRSKFITFWSFIARREVINYLYENSYKGKSSTFAGISLDRAIDEGDANIAVLSDSMGTEDTRVEANFVYKEFKNIISKDDTILSDQDKEIFKLFLEGLSRDEIIRKLNCSVPCYYRAIKKGKIVLGKHYEN